MSLITPLAAHVASDAAWRAAHPEQDFFIRQLVEHFMEGSGSMGDNERIAFIRAMCDTGESARYGHRPQEGAAEEFARLLAQHAKRQFEDGRKALAQIKRALKGFAEQTLTKQLHGAVELADGEAVQARFVGQWEWCVMLRRPKPQANVFREFGPTAVVENRRATQPLADADFTKVFVSRDVRGEGGIEHIIQTGVGLGEVLAGLPADDERLRDAVLQIIDAP